MVSAFKFKYNYCFEFDDATFYEYIIILNMNIFHGDSLGSFVG